MDGERNLELDAWRSRPGTVLLEAWMGRLPPDIAFHWGWLLNRCGLECGIELAEVLHRYYPQRPTAPGPLELGPKDLPGQRGYYTT